MGPGGFFQALGAVAPRWSTPADCQTVADAAYLHGTNHGGGGGYHLIPGGATGFANNANIDPLTGGPMQMPADGVGRGFDVGVSSNSETVVHRFFGMTANNVPNAWPRWYYGVHPAAPRDTLTKFGMGALRGAIEDIFDDNGVADLPQLIADGHIELRMLEPRPASTSSANRPAVRIDRVQAQPRFSGGLLSEGAKRHFLRHLYIQCDDHFTKTGSGQT